MLFSIVVPAYNSAWFLRKCVDSVLAQSYSRFELILVDDGSNDDTWNICRAYSEADPRVKAIHKENGGHTSARNEGLRASLGEYVIFLDSDDWLADQTLEACCREIVTHDPDVVIYGMENSDGSRPYSVRLADGCYDVRDLEKDPINQLLLSPNGDFTFPKSLSAKCFRREAIYDAQLNIPKEIALGEDGAAFIGAMISAERVSVIAGRPEARYFCLIRSDSVSRRADADAFRKATTLLLYYEGLLSRTRVDYTPQFCRNVVAQLYTATLLVMRSGGAAALLNEGLDTALRNPSLAKGLKKAKFSLKGYKFTIKKLILRHRLWRLAGFLDG